MFCPRRLAVHVWIFSLASDPAAWVDASVHASESKVADDKEKTRRSTERSTQDSEFTGESFFFKERPCCFSNLSGYLAIRLVDVADLFSCLMAIRVPQPFSLADRL